jgi:hypothetical protein
MWSIAHPGVPTVVVLATDGLPNECDVNPDHLDAIAAAGSSGTPKILTFVIGVGSSLTALNRIASSGGTDSAFLVDTGGNVNQQFLTALNRVRGTALGCEYRIPSPANGGVPDYAAVNVRYTPTGGVPGIIPQVAGKAACPLSGNAWYYDDVNNPTTILLCDATCSAVQSDSAGQVQIELGCSTVIL